MLSSPLMLSTVASPSADLIRRSRRSASPGGWFCSVSNSFSRVSRRAFMAACLDWPTSPSYPQSRPLWMQEPHFGRVPSHCPLPSRHPGLASCTLVHRKARKTLTLALFLRQSLQACVTVLSLFAFRLADSSDISGTGRLASCIPEKMPLREGGEDIAKWSPIADGALCVCDLSCLSAS